MVEDRAGDLLTQPDLTHLVHQANLYHTFGSGLAAEIKRTFPEAYQADKETLKGSVTKLGSFSTGFCKRRKGPGVWVVNLYSQVGISATERTTSYDAMDRGLTLLEAQLRAVSEKEIVCVGFPYKLGCGLAGGRWPVVEAMIMDVFGKSPVRALICRRAWD